MESLTDLLSTFSTIPITNKTILFAVVMVIGVLGYKILDDWKFKKYYDDMKSEKNKEIERLADDNRRYRDIYLKSLGFNQEEVDVISAANMKGG